MIPTRDCALAPGQISDDDTPTFKGVTHSERMLDWLAAHGIKTADAIKWDVARTGKKLDAERAEIALGEAPCFSFMIEKEEALVCATPGLDTVMPWSALGIVVRNKKPVVVLETGVQLRALDEPSVRYLDLQLDFATDFKSFELKDRAAPGATLVEAPSVCAAHQKMLEECLARLTSGEGDTSLCPIVTDEYGQKRVNAAQSQDPAYPAEVYGCANVPAEQRASAFVRRSCAARGKWKWIGGRYVKAS